MIVTFEPAARDELDQIFDRIAEDRPRAAHAMIARIEEKVMQLATPELANMGRPGLAEGTRELVEPPYIIVYKVYDDRDEIRVVAVVHGARDRRDNDN